MSSASFTILPNKYYRESTPFPGFWFSGKYRLIRGGDKILEALMKKEFDPNEVVILSTKPSGEYRKLALDVKPAKVTEAEITHFEPDEIRISLNGQAGWLTVSDTYYPGWSALVDGRSRPVYRGNYIFRTIPILPGDRELILRYEAPALKKGMTISILTLLIVVILLVIIRIMEKRKNR